MWDKNRGSGFSGPFIIKGSHMKALIIGLALTLGSLSAMAGDCKDGTILDEKTGECVAVDVEKK